MVRPQIHPMYAAAGALLVFGLFEAATIPLSEFGQISSMSTGEFNVYALLIALADWVGCIACVYLGMKLSRSEPVKTASFLASVLAAWHLYMIFALFSFAEILNDCIVPYSVVYYGGLLVTAVFLVMGYERRTAKGSQANRSALAALGKQSVYGEALATAGLDYLKPADFSNLTQTNPTEAAKNSARLPRTLELTEAEERSASFFDLDLIMLEGELLKIKPNRDAYISALRLGIAIEKDMGFVNCRARTFTFAELMRDVCTRLSVTLGEDGQWPAIADSFRHYAQDDRLVRRNKIAACVDALIATQLKVAVQAADLGLVSDEEATGGLAELEDKILASVL